MSLRRIGLPTISPVANTSPVVSTAVMNITISIETIAATPNVGRPKWNGVVTPTAFASETPPMSTRPKTRGDRGAEHEAEQHGDRGEEARRGTSAAARR